MSTTKALVCVPGDDLAICEQVFTDTNLYEGVIWDALQPLPEGRTHTSLSVGDVVIIDGRAYECASIGFERAREFDAPALSA